MPAPNLRALQLLLGGAGTTPPQPGGGISGLPTGLGTSSSDPSELIRLLIEQITAPQQVPAVEPEKLGGGKLFAVGLGDALRNAARAFSPAVPGSNLLQELIQQRRGEAQTATERNQLAENQRVGASNARTQALIGVEQGRQESAATAARQRQEDARKDAEAKAKSDSARADRDLRKEIAQLQSDTQKEVAALRATSGSGAAPKLSEGDKNAIREVMSGLTADAKTIDERLAAGDDPDTLLDDIVSGVVDFQLPPEAQLAALQRIQRTILPKVEAEKARRRRSEGRLDPNDPGAENQPPLRRIIRPRQSASDVSQRPTPFGIGGILGFTGKQ